MRMLRFNLQFHRDFAAASRSIRKREAVLPRPARSFRCRPYLGAAMAIVVVMM